MTPERKAELAPIAELTLEDLERAVAELPEGLRQALSCGPTRERYSCAVCRTFEGYIERWEHFDPEPDGPCWIVWNWHEVPKMHMTRAEDQWYGPLANAVYERCIQTYRAAGWTGVPEPANA